MSAPDPKQTFLGTRKDPTGKSVGSFVDAVHRLEGEEASEPPKTNVKSYE